MYWRSHRKLSLRPQISVSAVARVSYRFPGIHRLLGIGIVGVLLATLSACGTSEPFVLFDEGLQATDVPPDSTLAYSVFLIGDAGAPETESARAVLDLLRKGLNEQGRYSAVVFLGDNLYPSGLPPASHPGRALAEERLGILLDVVEDHPGPVVFVPGNHDWGNGGLGGDRNAVIRQEEYIESRLGRDVWMPDRGFPGPVDVDLGDDIALIVLDTQWWLEDRRPYGDTGTYELEQEGEFLLELDDVLWRNADRHRVVVAHHPIFTNGEHGGRFRGLRSLLIGERIARRYLGTPQDLSNLKYRRLRKGLLAIFENHRDLVYAAGHDHGLQYFQHNDQHYVVSGAGSKLGYVEPGYGARFVAERKGFASLQYFTDGSIWLSFHSPGEDGSDEVLFRSRLREGVRPLIAFRPDEAEYPSVAAQVDVDSERASEMAAPYEFYSRGTVQVVAGPQYDRDNFGRFFLGDHYRDIWTLPITAPVIDLEKTAGGLTPIQKGGGLQTLSLRLLGGDGDQYVLRSVDKDPTPSIPEYLRETIAHDVVRDQIAAMHPYSALVLPKMADAAGIYHTSPTLVYIPDDPRLGIYRSTFAGMLATFEARPDEDQSDEARFGFAKNVIGTPKLFEEIVEDNDERVDQRAFVRARLFDMMIGDWDRHADQWRWAEFDVTPGKIYRPIPRDRDFAFFRFDGLLPKVIRRSGDLKFRRFTNFESLYSDILGLNYNGASLDRRFTSGLSRSDWMEIADSLQAALTDDVIDEAVRDFPPEVYAHHGEWIASLLKQRRDLLKEAVDAYYPVLVENVDIVGSDKHERFEVTRLSNDSTLVVMYKTSKEGEIDRELIRRIIYTDETDEVRLYGLGGNDHFRITGNVGRGIRVRAIGGTGEDTFVDSSSVAGLTKHTIFHDSVEGNHWFTSSETRRIRSDDPANNAYEMYRFELDERRPLVHVSRNADDGVLLGGGFKFVRSGFRKTPYAAQHRLFGTAATLRPAFNLHYRGRFIEEFGRWNAIVEADLFSDRRYRNFYGFGNETDLDARDQFQIRMQRFSAEPSFERPLLPFTTVRIGPRYELTRISRPDDGIQPLIPDETFADHHFVGVRAELQVDGTDTLAATENGVRWLNSISANIDARSASDVFLRLSSEISYFYTFYRPTRVTLGFRAGGATNIGDFEFFQANTLGGQENLRGFRKTRFAGHTAVFGNLDVRVQLFHYNVYLMRGIGGIIGFYDTGRVWAGIDRFNLSPLKLHHGYGGGIWLAPFNRIAVTATVEVSNENTLLDLSIGFQF